MSYRMSGINPTMYNQSRDWRTAAREIQEARKELADHANIMTPYERQSISGAIKKQAERDYSLIYQGVSAQLFDTSKRYLEKQTEIEDAHKRQSKSWDNARLGIEMNTFQVLVNNALQSSGTPGFTRGHISERVSEIYQEAVRSGDFHKQRAAAEVLRSINIDKLEKDIALPVRMLQRQAEADLTKLQTPPTLAKLQEELGAIQKELTGDLQEVATAADILGEPIDRVFHGGTFTKLFKTVQLDRETGELKIYKLDDPEVTGIRFTDGSEDAGLTIGG